MSKHKIEKKIKDFIIKYKMVSSQDKIIIGVSGGADSVCLLFALKELSLEWGFTFVVVHVNHGLRGESAYRDEEFVKACCNQLDVTCYTYRVNVKEVAMAEKLSTEEAGRVLRRQTFEKVMEKTGSNKIALAHHQNDNAETLLMNLARGSGIRGLCGMKPVNGHYIRPLLCVTREEIEEFLGERELTFCIDETNTDISFTRNRVRNVIVPNLEKVNQEAVLHMNETMNHLKEIEEFVELKVEEEFFNLVEIQGGSLRESSVKAHKGEERDSQKTVPFRYYLNYENFMAQPAIIQKATVKRVIEEASGEKKDISRVHVEQVLELFKKQVGKSVNLPYGIVGFKEYEGVVIARKSADVVKGKLSCHEGQPSVMGEKEGIAINIPGFTKVPAYNIIVECKWIEHKDIEPAHSCLCESSLTAHEATFYKPKDLIYTKAIDYDIMKNGLFLRTREPGDTITVDKKGSKQKLKSYFINEKIPKSKRDTIPLFVDGKEVVWVVGYRMNMKYHIKEDTKKILEIKVHHPK